jgi:hypothetical protein
MPAQPPPRRLIPGLSETPTVILDRVGLCLDSAQYRQLTAVGLGGSLAFQRSKVLATRAAASRATASSCSFGAVASTSASHSGKSVQCLSAVGIRRSTQGVGHSGNRFPRVWDPPGW